MKPLIYKKRDGLAYLCILIYLTAGIWLGRLQLPLVG